MTGVQDVGAVAARYWWVLLVRGILLIALGIMMVTWPQATVLVILVLFAAYLIVDGVMALAEGFTERREGRPSGWFFTQGVLAIIAGIVVLVWPSATATVVVWVIAFWAILAGITGIVGGLAQRKLPDSGWGWFLAWGVLALVFGIVLLFNPTAGILTVLWLVAIWAICAGVVLAIASFFVRNAGRTLAAGHPR